MLTIFLKLSLAVQVLVSSWLVFCLVITTAFRSSLYAHLTSQTPPPINTLEDLVQTDGWTWGSQKMEGATYMYFFENSNPTMQVIASKMQVRSRLFRVGPEVEVKLRN